MTNFWQVSNRPAYLMGILRRYSQRDRNPQDQRYEGALGGSSWEGDHRRDRGSYRDSWDGGGDRYGGSDQVHFATCVCAFVNAVLSGLGA